MSEAKTCQVCRRSIGAEEVAFVLRIDLFADPTPPEITKEDMEKDWRKEMEALIEAMSKMDPEEAADEVFERYRYWVCKNCRKRIHHQLKFPFLSIQ